MQVAVHVLAQRFLSPNKEDATYYKVGIRYTYNFI